MRIPNKLIITQIYTLLLDIIYSFIQVTKNFKYFENFPCK